MSMTIAVLTDVHFGEPGPIAARRGELGAILLRRAVERLNRFVQPQLVVVLGDVINVPTGPRADDELRELRTILDRLACPYLAIPGNHDPDPQRFYRVMPEPEPRLDFEGVRVLSFADAEAPGYHAHRADADLARLGAARDDGFTGPLVTLQHVPVMPRGRELRYSYTNLDDVLAAHRAAGVTLSLGGHCHGAAEAHDADTGLHVAVEALCESPHGYALVHIDAQARVEVERQALAMPESLNLVDLHSHTQLAYCAEDVSVEQSPRIAEAMGMRALALTEHSGHLYFSAEDFGSGKVCEGGVASASATDERVGTYFDLVRAAEAPVPIVLGMELDVDFAGTPVVKDAHRAQLAWAVGAVHFLPQAAQANEAAFVEAFKHLTEAICSADIDVLAHPFRIFRRLGRPVPRSLYPWLVDLLRRTGVAAEINFHTNEPHEPFVAMCIEAGIKLSFGSDAHALWEVGEFFGHLELLRRLGVTDMNDVNRLLI